MGRRVLQGPDYDFGPLLMGFSRRSLFAKSAAWLVQTEQVKLLHVPLPIIHLILILCMPSYT